MTNAGNPPDRRVSLPCACPCGVTLRIGGGRTTLGTAVRLAFAGAIMAFDQPGDGAHRFVIEQGYEMGRPSQIELTLTVAGGALASATIGGAAVVMSEGVLL